MQQLSFFDSMPRKARSFHSRKPIPGPASEAAQEIKRGEGKARQQEEAILAFYRANPGRGFAPSQVWQRVGPTWLLTSVRRSISNLTDRKNLRMTGDRRLSPFGAMEHLWELVPSKEGNQ